MKVNSITNNYFKGGIIANVPLVEGGFFKDKIVYHNLNSDDIVCVNDKGEMVLQIQPENDNFLVRFLNRFSEMSPKLALVNLPKNLDHFEKTVKDFRATVERMKRSDSYAVIEFDEL